MPEVTSHYFDSEPGESARQRGLDVVLAGRQLRVQVTDGVFSGDRIDPGTAVLLDKAPQPPATGNLLDLGCGWGPIAVTLALRSPGAAVWALDVNPRALADTAANAQWAGCANITTATPDSVPDDIAFDAIWSNPPIRIGKSALHDMLARWLARLTPGGSSYLVVQKNLGADSLHTWLSETFPRRAVTRYASAKGYRILRIQ